VLETLLSLKLNVACMHILTLMAYAGTIPAAALGQLTELTFLSLAHNKLAGVCVMIAFIHYYTVTLILQLITALIDVCTSVPRTLLYTCGCTTRRHNTSNTVLSGRTRRSTFE
jgi:hypothetical protein